MNILSEIWDSLRRQRFRTAMTGFAVGWGIFILIVLLGASSGLEHGIQASYGSRVVNSMDIWAGWTSMPYKGLPSQRSMMFTQRDADIVRHQPEVDKFSASMQYLWLYVSYGANESSLQIKGVEGEFQDIVNRKILAGRFLNNRDMHEYAKVAVIEEKAMHELSLTPDIVGKYIRIQDIPFRVIGICETANSWGNGAVYIPLSTHQKIFSTNKKFDHMSFTLRTVNDTTQQRLFEERLRTQLAASMQFDPRDQQAVGMWSQQASMEEQSKVMDTIRMFILIIALCTLLSGAVGVSNIMLVSVGERKKEIGIRKALGAPPAHILTMIVGEALLIMIIFGGIGMFAGIGLVELVGQMIPVQEEGFGAIFRNPTVDMRAVAIATSILVIIGTIAGFMPAWKAVKIKPIEAMNAGK